MPPLLAQSGTKNSKRLENKFTKLCTFARPAALASCLWNGCADPLPPPIKGEGRGANRKRKRDTVVYVSHRRHDPTGARQSHTTQKDPYVIRTWEPTAHPLFLIHPSTTATPAAVAATAVLPDSCAPACSRPCLHPTHNSHPLITAPPAAALALAAAPPWCGPGGCAAASARSPPAAAPFPTPAARCVGVCVWGGAWLSVCVHGSLLVSIRILPWSRHTTQGGSLINLHIDIQ